MFLRNFHQAYVSAKAEGLPEGYYYPLVHCGTSFGNYKEVRGYLLESAELRERVKKILGKLDRLVDGKLLIPEEVVHYSEWAHVMRDEIAKHRVVDCSNIRATIHPACHVYKMVPQDAIYDDSVLEGNRVAVSTGLIQTLGANVIDYSTWYDCCGFGFRHIISEREFTRSFAIDRKIRVAQDEAHSDVMIGHDTGCITTLDKSQWIGAAAGKDVDLPVLADVQFAACVCGAHPYKIVQSHWHASSTEKLMDKLGIDWHAKKAEFEAYLEEIKIGKQENLYDPRRMITSGPGFKPLPQSTQTAAGLAVRTPVLIVGGGPAGLAAATALASVGCPNVLVEKMTGLAARRSYRAMPSSFPPGNGPRTPLAGWFRGVAGNGSTDIRLNTIVQTFEGEPGRFTATLVRWLRYYGNLSDFGDGLYAFRLDQQA